MMKDVNAFSLGELETLFLVARNEFIVEKVRDLRRDLIDALSDMEKYQVQAEAVLVQKARKAAQPTVREKSYDEMYLDQCVLIPFGAVDVHP